MPDTQEARRAGCATGPKKCSFGENAPPIAQRKSPPQANSAVRRRCSHLRLVENPGGPALPPRQRWLGVWVLARNGPEPFGRSRPFWLRPDDLEALIAAAELIEAEGGAP
jgi:hypothetical protein